MMTFSTKCLALIVAVVTASVFWNRHLLFNYPTASDDVSRVSSRPPIETQRISDPPTHGKPRVELPVPAQPATPRVELMAEAQNAGKSEFSDNQARLLDAPGSKMNSDSSGSSRQRDNHNSFAEERDYREKRDL